MLVVDEERLSSETLVSIAKDYGMINEGMSDDDCIKSVVKRFYWDVDAFKNKLMEIVEKGIKIYWEPRW